MAVSQIDVANVFPANGGIFMSSRWQEKLKAGLVTVAAGRRAAARRQGAQAFSSVWRRPSSDGVLTERRTYITVPLRLVCLEGEK